METIFDLLNIDKEQFESFAIQAKSIGGLQLDRVFNRNIKRLKEIEKDCYVDTDHISKDIKDSRKEILSKVKQLSSSRELFEEWTILELRNLSYLLYELQDSEVVYTYALQVLDDKWKPLLFNGVIYSIMYNWIFLNEDYKEILCDFIQRKLMLYEGDNNRYLNLKNNMNFFDVNGPLRMSSLLHYKGISIIDAPILLKNQSSTITQSYYSDVIVEYYRNRETINIGELENLFNIHNFSRTKKLLLASIVEEANEDGTEYLQEQVSRLADKILGNITIKATWAPFKGATEIEKEQLIRARDLVNQWYARKVIEVFFDICVQENLRKEFWLKYVPYISNFKIVASRSVKGQLNANNTVRNMLDNYFIPTNSIVTQSKALVLYLKDKVFVEFSDVGALYIYNNNHKIIRTFNKCKSVTSFSDLKDGSFQQAIIRGSYGELDFSDEGKMVHQGNWQYRLKEWFKEKMDINLQYD